MNKATLIDKISEKAHVSKRQAESMINGLVKIIIGELVEGRKVNIVGFGSFEARTRHARGGINPQKPTERITIPEVRVAKFKTGKTLKDALKDSLKKPQETTPETEA